MSASARNVPREYGELVVLTVEQVADLLWIDPPDVEQALLEGRLVGRRGPAGWRVSPAAVLRFVDELPVVVD